jgi:4-hydroxy-tetrahydrodipicolinate reductase
VNLLLLGKGKTGSLVAEVAREKGHSATALGSSENPHGRALSADALREVDVIIDFTNPEAALANIRAWLAACKSGARAAMVVGATGWYAALPEIRNEVEQAGGGFLYASNFSIGVNIFFEIARAAAPALAHGYEVRIMERHHAQKKDAPSGTALAIRDRLQSKEDQDDAKKIEITSIREGDAVGQHVVLIEGPSDTMMLVHDAKSRRAFAEGAVLAAEWIKGKRGFFTFADVLR